MTDKSHVSVSRGCAAPFVAEICQDRRREAERTRSWNLRLFRQGKRVATSVLVVHVHSFVLMPSFGLTVDQPARRAFEDTENRLSVAYVFPRES
jgi:hypothetical protein